MMSQMDALRVPARLGLAGLSLILMLAAACDDSASTGDADREELFTQGPFEVGYRELTISYDAVGSSAKRELLLRVWYPARDDSDAPPAIYAVADFEVVEVPAPFALDAPPVTEERGLPLALYSHGNGGEGLLAYPYGELMASHGWIVVAPNHTGNTALELLRGEADPAARVALDRPHDLTAIIDELESGLVGDELEAKADTSRVYVFGHSFGGYTTFAAAGADVDYDALRADCDATPTSEDCEVLADPGVEQAYRAGFGDPRVVAIAPQAPALLGMSQEQLAQLEVPTMLMTGRLDQTTTQQESAEPAWAGIDEPGDLWVEMPEGGHFSFISICDDLAPGVLMLFQPDAEEDGCGTGFIPSAEAVPVLAAYVLAFGRRHVLGETQWDAVLMGEPLGDGFVVTLKP